MWYYNVCYVHSFTPGYVMVGSFFRLGTTAEAGVKLVRCQQPVLTFTSLNSTIIN